MGKQITALLLAVVLMSFFTTTAFAWGITGSGEFADAAKRYGFVDDAKIVYNGEISYQDYDEVYVGSAIYIPIGIQDDDGNVTHATAQNIKKDKVSVSHKVTRGARHVTGVSIVDGGKEKISGLDKGAYVKVQLTDSYSGTGTANIEVKLVLVINRMAHQETEIELYCTMENRTVYIDYDTVYGAQLPTLFEVGYHYNGEATFDMGNDVRYTARVKARQKYIIDYDTQTNEEIAARYPKNNLEFHNFKGERTTFASNGKLELPLDSATYYKNRQYKAYAYKISGNTLVPMDSNISKDGILTLYTRTLESYVISDVDLLNLKDDQASTPAPAPATSAASQSGANQLQAPPMGGAPLPALPTESSAPALVETAPPPATSQPETPQVSSVTPPPASLSHISAVNKGTENPLTGAPPLVGIAVMGTLTGWGAWLLRPRKK
jgi:hypothetical protein